MDITIKTFDDGSEFTTNHLIGLGVVAVAYVAVVTSIVYFSDSEERDRRKRRREAKKQNKK